MAGYKQTTNWLSDVSQPRGGKATINRIYLWQFKYVNAMLIVLCISNGLISGYITGTHDKELSHQTHVTFAAQTVRVFQLSCSILSVDCSVIIYAMDDSQLTLYSR